MRIFTKNNILWLDLRKKDFLAFKHNPESKDLILNQTSTFQTKPLSAEPKQRANIKELAFTTVKEKQHLPKDFTFTLANPVKKTLKLESKTHQQAIIENANPLHTELEALNKEYKIQSEVYTNTAKHPTAINAKCYFNFNHSFKHLASNYEGAFKLRVRISSGLKDSPTARAFLKANFKLLLENKEAFRKKFAHLEDEKIMKELLKLEQKQDKKELIKELAKLKELFFKENINLSYLSVKKCESNFSFFNQFFTKYKISLNHFSQKAKAKYVVLEFLEFCSKKGLSNSTIRLKASFLKRILNLAVDFELLDNHFYKLPKLKITNYKADEKLFDYEEALFLIKKARGELKTYLAIAFFTGMRVGEILGLKWEDLDFSQNLIHIKRTFIKKGFFSGGKTIYSASSIDMLEIVKYHLLPLQKHPESFIFTQNKAKLVKAFKELLKSLNYPDTRLYITRHSFASMMLKRGEDLAWISKKMLRHSNLHQTLTTYAKYIDSKNVSRASFIKESDYTQTTDFKGEKNA